MLLPNFMLVSPSEQLKLLATTLAELKYKSLYGDQEFDIYLIKFVQCMCSLPN